MELPREILGMIFAHFVGPFDHRSDFWNNTIYEHADNRKTLASLCRVSKSFNAVATGLLYSQIRMFDGDIRFFTRTILQDQLKSKTNLVKWLSLEFGLAGGDIDEGGRTPVPSVERGQWDFERCLREALTVLGVDNPTKSTTAEWEFNPLAFKDLNLEDKPEEDLAAVLLFLLPELRSLRVNMDPMTYYPDPESVGYWTCEMLLQTLRLSYFNKYIEPENGNHSDQICIGASLPVGLLKLEQLIMCNPFEKAGHIKSTYPPIVWCNLNELQPLWTLPKLKSLTLERVRGYISINSQTQKPKQFVQATTLENLELLDTAIEPSELPHFLQSFPSLRSITYEVADKFSLTHFDDVILTPDMLDSNDIRETIKRCKPGLEEISIKTIERKNLSEYELDELNDLWNGDEDDDEDEDEEDEE